MHAMQLDNGNSQASLARVRYKPHNQPYITHCCYRLGKFSHDTACPRPIMVKFVRIADVAKIFSRRRSLSPPFSIKPDMSRTQRLQESILMQERWHLVQYNVDHKSIKLRGGSLYVKDKLHGRVSNSKFVCVSASPKAPCGSNNPINPRSTSPTVEHQPQPVTLDVNTATSVTSDTTPVNNPCSQQNTSIDITTPPASPLTPIGAPALPNSGSSNT